VLGFPLPYPQELVYSTIARAGVHDGEVSPKQLLDSVFSDRRVIATVDLPSHMEKVAAQYPYGVSLTVDKLIDKHTLWPLYAPFIPPRRRQAIECWMKGESHGSVHLASGIAASRIKQKCSLHMCPVCLEEQVSEYGEDYWNRCWQVPMMKLCPMHGALHETNIRLHGEHRHAFIPLLEVKNTFELDVSDIDRKFANLVFPLLDKTILQSPTYYQWTLFYQELAKEFDFFTTGGRVKHTDIHCKYVSSWNGLWLRHWNLLPEKKDTAWLKGIFRKHRKSFSFAEHITVIDAMSEGEVQVAEAIKRAISLPSIEPTKKGVVAVSAQPLTKDQQLWLKEISLQCPKAVRKERSALYARLYRNHHGWLMQVNAEVRDSSPYFNNRVNWGDRDRQAAITLRREILRLEENLFLPRHSKSFLLHQLPNAVSIEKNLDKLPRCRTLLKYYSESIAEYQVRRLTTALIMNQKEHKKIKRWSLLRQAGLSDDRIFDLAGNFLKGVLKE